MADPRGAIKWATFVFWNFLNPAFYTHHRYYRNKVVLDRFLERKGFVVTAGLGIAIGGVSFLFIQPFLPNSGLPQDHTMQDSANTILRAMNMDASKEFPVFTLLRAKSEIFTKLYAAVDKADVKRQKAEVERVKLELESLKTSAANATRETVSGAPVRAIV